METKPQIRADERLLIDKESWKKKKREIELSTRLYPIPIQFFSTVRIES